MRLAPVPSDVFAALARTRPAPSGTDALRAGLHARRLLLLKSLLARVDRQRARLDPTVVARFDHDWELLERAEQSAPGAVRDVIDYPLTGAWLAEVLAAPEGAEFDRHLTHLGGIAAAAALRAGCRFATTLQAPTGLLTLPGIGVLSCPGGSARLHGRAGLLLLVGAGRRTGAVLFPAAPAGGRGPTAAGPGWKGVRTLQGGTTALDDLDPYRVPRSGVGAAARRAAGHRPADHRSWGQCWSGAHRLLAATDPGRKAEITALLRTVVPIAPGDPGEAAMSATLRAAPGAVLTSLPDGPQEMAEILVHETHHTKLAALHERVPLHRAGDGARHRVGWRPDPRPIPGILQGAYAHLALTDLWRRAVAGPGLPRPWRQRAAAQFDTYREQVGEALSLLLESDELTIEGREFTEEMGRHHARLGNAVRILG